MDTQSMRIVPDGCGLKQTKYVTLAYQISDKSIFVETCYMFRLSRVESQLHNDDNSRTMTELWHLEPTRGEKWKADKKALKFCIILLDENNTRAVA